MYNPQTLKMSFVWEEKHLHQNLQKKIKKE